MEHFVGIDVSKDRPDVHLRLRALAPALVVMEATGGYETVVASAIAAAHLPLAVVNPRQIRDFARATGKLAKTDRLDAAAIAHFAEAVRPPSRPLDEPAAQALGELVARRRQVIEMIVAEGNRRRGPTNAGASGRSNGTSRCCRPNCPSWTATSTTPSATTQLGPPMPTS